ncbi:MAG TPA: GatB/YqeY domain-containing protein [Gemmatimonas sp.]|nr:GatB/YqeY domain-containing protein [Gemmatimonas sp.]
MTAGEGTLLERLQADQATARRSQEKDRVMTLGMLISELKNRELELRRELSDDDAVDVIRKGIKRRREAVVMYDKAARADLSAKESSEAAMLEAYLPAAVDPEELRVAVRGSIAAGATSIGAIMARVMPQFRGRADGSAINAMARDELAASNAG